MGNKQNKIFVTEEELVRISSKSDLVFKCVYPEENSEQVIEDITKGMEYLGFFDSLA